MSIIVTNLGGDNLYAIKKKKKNPKNVIVGGKGEKREGTCRPREHILYFLSTCWMKHLTSLNVPL